MPIQNRNRRNRRGGRRQGRNNLNLRGGSVNHIPQIQSDLKFSHHYRYVNGLGVSPAAGPISILRRFLLNQILVGAGMTNSYRVIEAIRLKKIEIWGISGDNTSDYKSTAISVEWLSTLGPATLVSDRGTAIHPPHLVTRPPKNSLAGFWSMSGINESDTLFIIQTTIGVVVDVWYDIVIQNNFDSNQSAITVTTTASTSAGIVYAAYLDGPNSLAGYVPDQMLSIN